MNVVSNVSKGSDLGNGRGKGGSKAISIPLDSGHFQTRKTPSRHLHVRAGQTGHRGPHASKHIPLLSAISLPASHQGIPGPSE
jgi:hypothetical protein